MNKKYNVIFESAETIYGIVPRANDWVKYEGILIVKDGGKKPVSMKMKFIPPHPFAINMPEEHSISADSITSLYAKIVKYFLRLGVEFRD